MRHLFGRERRRIAVQLDLQWFQLHRRARQFSDAILPLLACRTAATTLGSDAVALRLRGSRVQFGAWTFSRPV